MYLRIFTLKVCHMSDELARATILIGDAMFRDLMREYDLFVKEAAGESRRPT